MILALMLAAGAAAADLSGVAQLLRPRSGGFSQEFCVGTLVDTGAGPAAPAYLASNAHCYAFFRDPSAVIFARAVDIPVEFTARGVRARIVAMEYGSMRGTDRALFKLDKTLGELETAGVRGLRLAASPPPLGEKMLRAQTHSETYECELESAGLRVKEERYVYEESFRYFCFSRHGSSGSPLVSRESGLLFGVHNTGRARVGRCTLDDMCELDPQGRPVKPPYQANYGQRVDVLARCFDAGGRFEAGRPGCGPL